MTDSPDNLRELDKRHFWHPFTQMREWTAPDHDPLVIASGEGAILRDLEGREYLDGNSSIWTNIHGHNHPAINRAIRDQLERIAHCSALGSTNEPAILLAARLAGLFPPDSLSRCFFSDDGSTAMECAMKMAIQYWQLKGCPGRCEFFAFSRAYHGDTLGAASLGAISSFHSRFAGLGVKTHHVSTLAELSTLDASATRNIAAVAIEPLVQGAAGIRLWPEGTLRELRAWCDCHGVFLLFDEVMTGFGRTGTMFACEQENVVPDMIALAKGLTGGYLPLAATLVTEEIYETFLGEVEEGRTFFHGHSYSGNALGCAAALASLALFEEENTLPRLAPRIEHLRQLLGNLVRENAYVSECRQAGFIAGIDLVDADGQPFAWTEQRGHRVCLAARRHGLLTRPVQDTVVLMPPLCTTEAQLDSALEAIDRAILEVCTP
ncbi:MAG: adenosylmethionine--8-amino-7-oxononanoate transaminase [Verrucomicrobiales bacterium]